MATKYNQSSKIDPDLRGTVDFDFFESEEFEKSKDETKDKAQKEDDKDYYDDDDDSFESDDDDDDDYKQENNDKKSVKSSSKNDRDDVKPETTPSKSSNTTSINTRNKQKRQSPKHEKQKSRNNNNPKQRHDSDVSSSDSDITQVSPLTSPKPTRKQAQPEPAQAPSKPERKDKKDKVTLIEPDEKLDMDVLMQTIMKLEEERARQNVMFIPPKENESLTSETDRNFSFNKDKIDEIERENHRLLHKILNQHTRRNTLGGERVVKPEYALPPCKRQFHSAVNRQKEQRRIERENMKILNRLQTVKATKHVRRDELLRQTRKQAMYGIPVHTDTSTSHSTGRQRRHSADTISVNSAGQIEESFVDAEYKGDTQVNRTQVSRPRSAKKSVETGNGFTGQPAGKKRPEWSDRW